MAVIGDLVGEVRDLRFERGILRVEAGAFARVIVGGVVLHQALAHFPREVQAGEAGILLLQFLDDAQAVAVVLEATVTAHQLVERHLALVPERRMAEVVGERDGLGEVFV